MICLKWCEESMHLPDVAVYSARTVLPTEARAYTIVMTEFAVSP